MSVVIKRIIFSSNRMSNDYFLLKSIESTIASKNLALLQNVLMGVNMCLVSIIPDNTSGNIGVNRKKFSLLTNVMSILISS